MTHSQDLFSGRMKSEPFAKYGQLKLMPKKTKVLMVSTHRLKIWLNTEDIEHVSECRYLGSMLPQNLDSEKEVKAAIEKAKDRF